MSYIEESLLQEEELLYETKLHWAIFFGPAVVILFALWAFIENSVDASIPSFILALGIIWGGYKALEYVSSEFGVTDQRVLSKRGVLNIHSVEIRLDRVESVDLRQGPLAQLLNYGTIVIGGTGGVKQEFDGIAGPHDLRFEINEARSG